MVELEAVMDLSTHLNNLLKHPQGRHNTVTEIQKILSGYARNKLPSLKDLSYEFHVLMPEQTSTATRGSRMEKLVYQYC